MTAAPTPPSKKRTSPILQYSAVGLEMGVSVILGIAGGLFIDKKFDTEPYFFWLGFILGIGAATKTIVNIAKKAQKDLSDDEIEPPKKN